MFGITSLSMHEHSGRKHKKRPVLVYYYHLNRKNDESMKLLTTGVKNLSHGIDSKGKFQKRFV